MIRQLDPELLIAAVYVLAVVAIEWWARGRARSIARDWLTERGYQTLSLKRRWLFTGPFAGAGRGSWVVLRAEVMAPNGRVRTGWIRVGGYWFGVLQRRVAVEWDAQESPGGSGIPAPL